MHRGRVVLGTVLGGALAVAVATQVSSWSPDDSAWDGYGPALPPRTPTPQPMPADYTTPPECRDEEAAALREAERTGATMFAVTCREGPAEDCEPGYVEVATGNGRTEYVLRTCPAFEDDHAVVQVP